MSKHPTLLAVVAIVISAAPLSADIAPTEFKGGGVVPVGASDIRLLSAKVDIDWGTPCALSAVFVVENESSQAIEVPLGFPMPLGLGSTPSDEFAKKIQSNFLFAFDGVPLKQNAISKVGNPNDVSYQGVVWYRCRHIFLPEKTTVHVRSRLPASQGDVWPLRERLQYCIETGGSWKGKIGYEEVNIHFPHPVSKEQITAATPRSYIISGHTVRWQFKDFEPKGTDHDIRIEYFQPGVLAVLGSLEAAHRKKPADSTLTLKLARHLFALGARGGYSHFPPSSLSRADYAALLVSIPSPEDRALVQSRYALTKKDRHEEKDSQWTNERLSLVRILNKIDYQPPYKKSPHVNKAKALVEQILRDEPTNAEAWNVYLGNYYAFRFAGVSPVYPNEDYFQHQLDLIAEAHKLCPNDPGIRLWFECVSGRQTPQLDGIWDQLRKYGVFKTGYPKIEYSYW